MPVASHGNSIGIGEVADHIDKLYGENELEKDSKGSI